MQTKPLDQSLGRGLWTTIRLLPRVSRPMSAAVTVLMIVGGLLPVAFTIAAGILVGRVPAAVRDGLGGPGGQALIRALAVVAGLFVLQQMLGIVTDHLTDVLGRRLNGHLRDRVVEASLAPEGIAHLEDNEVIDTMMVARNVAPGFYTPGGAVYGIVGGVGTRLESVGSAVVVATFNPWLAAGMFAVSLVGQALLLKAFFRSIRMVMTSGAGSTEFRRSVYFRDLALTADASKELRIFGLGGWVSRRYSTSFLDAMADSWAQRRSGYGTLALTAVLFAGTVLAGLGVVTLAALDGQLDLGRYAVLFGAVLGTAMFMASDNDLRAAYGAAAVPAILDLERLSTEVEARHGPVRAATTTPLPAEAPAVAICFEGIDFSYPGADRPVFEGLDLEIPAGGSLAIVGINGAGKTTLVKLLGGLYRPQAGRITIDGVDLARVDPHEWRRHLAVLFQDYVRYALPAHDNVGFGAPGLDDPRACVTAAARAGALDLIDALEDGWDTVLSRTLTGGADLSGGQWQRVALARALLATEAGARVLVLDEPTANLDVRAEADIYDKFIDLTQGLTTIVISHRFSTVRRADQIVVIDDGRVTERGSHDDLLALGGRYATMFRVQADRFGDGNGHADGSETGATTDA